MDITAEPTELDQIRPMRELYRSEMRCQIIHDSIHHRRGWTQEYLLRRGGKAAGYGSVAITGPWKERPAVYEFYVIPEHRSHVFDLFSVLADRCAAPAIEIQSNDALGVAMLHAFARDVTTDAILFHDRLTTTHALPQDASFRQATPQEASGTDVSDLPWRCVVTVDGEVAAAGGVLFHYNPPYGDIYMDVEERFRRRGFGTYIVQELKRLCYERGFIPGARCSPANVASRQTLQRAGFVPCGFVMNGALR